MLNEIESILIIFLNLTGYLDVFPHETKGGGGFPISESLNH